MHLTFHKKGYATPCILEFCGINMNENNRKAMLLYLITPLLINSAIFLEFTFFTQPHKLSLYHNVQRSAVSRSSILPYGKSFFGV